MSSAVPAPSPARRRSESGNGAEPAQRPALAKGVAELGEQVLGFVQDRRPLFELGEPISEMPAPQLGFGT